MWCLHVVDEWEKCFIFFLEAERVEMKGRAKTGDIELNPSKIPPSLLLCSSIPPSLSVLPVCPSLQLPGRHLGGGTSVVDLRKERGLRQAENTACCARLSLTFQLLRHLSPQCFPTGPSIPKLTPRNHQNTPTTAAVIIANITSLALFESLVTREEKTK